MTKFTLSAGTSAPSYRGRRSASLPEEVPEPSPNARYWTPNQEPDTPLQCGCFIPWPITCLVGSTSRTGGKQVWCEDHGWQHVTKKEIARSERLNRKARTECSTSQEPMPDNPPF